MKIIKIILFIFFFILTKENECDDIVDVDQEIFLSPNEQYSIDLDIIYPIDLSNIIINRIFSSTEKNDFNEDNYFTHDISNRIRFINLPGEEKVKKKYLKIEQVLFSNEYFLGLEEDKLSVLFYNKSDQEFKIRLISIFSFTQNPFNYKCLNMIQIFDKNYKNDSCNSLIVIDCNLNKEENEVIILNLCLNNSMSLIFNNTVQKSVISSFYKCERTLWKRNLFIFNFCPFSHLKNEIRASFLDVYCISDNLIYQKCCTITNNLAIQDVKLDFDDNFVILDYNKGLFIYSKNCEKISQVPFHDNNNYSFLFLLNKNIDSIFRNKIKSYFYVGTEIDVLEIVYYSPNSIVYSKLFSVVSKNEIEDFVIFHAFLTENYLITFQKYKENQVNINENNTFYIRIFSINNINYPNLLENLNKTKRFLKGFVFSHYQDSFLLMTNEDNEENEELITFELYTVVDKTLKISYNEPVDLVFDYCLNLLVTSVRINTSFNSIIRLYLFPDNFTGIERSKNKIQTFTVKENYFQFNLNSYAFGPLIQYIFIGNGNYNNFQVYSHIGQIYMDDYYKLKIIDNDIISKNTILDCKFDLYNRFLKFLILSKENQIFFVYCFEFNRDYIGNCLKDNKITTLESNITSFSRDNYLFFIYMKDINIVKICLYSENVCSNYLMGIEFIEIIYITNNSIIGKRRKDSDTDLYNIFLYKLNIFINATTNNPKKYFTFTLTSMTNFSYNFDIKNDEFLGFDIQLINMNIFVIKTINKLIITELRLLNLTDSEIIPTQNFTIQNCFPVLIKEDKIITICYSQNLISEYSLKDAYSIQYNRIYPISYFLLDDYIKPFTDNNLLFVGAIDLNTNSYVVLIYNIDLPTSQMLIKVDYDNINFKKILFIRDAAPTHSMSVFQSNDNYESFVYIINLNPYLYGNFSKEEIKKFISNDSYQTQFDLCFSNGPKKYIKSIYGNLIYNESIINLKDKNYSSIRMNYSFLSNNSYYIPPHYFLEGPIENYYTKYSNDYKFKEILEEKQRLEDYETSLYYNKTLDIVHTSNVIIVLTDGFIIFLKHSNRNLIIIKKEKLDFLESSCKLANHKNETFFIYCQGNIDEDGYFYNSSNKNLFLCYFDISSLNLTIDSIIVPNKYGRIKQLIIKDNILFALSYSLNNRNQEVFCVCDYNTMLTYKNFSQIDCFMADRLNLFDFITLDFDVINNKLNDNIFIIIFILSAKMIDKNNIGLIKLDISSNKINLNYSKFVKLNSKYGEPQNINLLNYNLDDDVICIVSTNHNIYKLNFKITSLTENFINDAKMYTFLHYHKCKNIIQKPLYSENILISFCTREDQGENNSNLSPIFRQTINYSVILVYTLENNKDNSSMPIRASTKFLNDSYYQRKGILNKKTYNNKTFNELIISDLISFLIRFNVHENLTISFDDISKNNKTITVDITVKNHFGSNNLKFKFQFKPPDSSIRKLIVRVFFGIFICIGLIILIGFLFFSIRKIEKSQKTTRILGNIRGSLNFATNVITFDSSVVTKKNIDKKS